MEQTDTVALVDKMATLFLINCNKDLAIIREHKKIKFLQHLIYCLFHWFLPSTT